jgi:hypothetical protein
VAYAAEKGAENMMLRAAVLAPFAVILGLSIHMSAQGVATQVKSINTYCKQIDSLQKRRKVPDLLFANTADTDSTRERWRRFASERALEKHREGSETYDIAYNWRRGARVVASNFTHFSASGDWAKYVNHCFRTDGTLARVETDFRTFNGDFKVIRTRYFDTAGRQISSSAKYLDLQSRKPKNHSEGVMGDDPNDADFYKTVKKLPYARLLPK